MKKQEEPWHIIPPLQNLCLPCRPALPSIKSEQNANSVSQHCYVPTLNPTGATKLSANVTSQHSIQTNLSKYHMTNHSRKHKTGTVLSTLISMLACSASIQKLPARCYPELRALNPKVSFNTLSQHSIIDSNILPLRLHRTLHKLLAHTVPTQNVIDWSTFCSSLTPKCATIPAKSLTPKSLIVQCAGTLAIKSGRRVHKMRRRRKEKKTFFQGVNKVPEGSRNHL